MKLLCLSFFEPWIKPSKQLSRTNRSNSMIDSSIGFYPNQIAPLVCLQEGMWLGEKYKEIGRNGYKYDNVQTRNSCR